MEKKSLAEFSDLSAYNAGKSDLQGVHVVKIVNELAIKYSNIDNNGYEYVDLGLSSGTLWATCNVGTVNPEGYGDYFSWGEVSIKSSYAQSNYKWGNTSSGSNITKYNNSDNLTSLLPEDDVVHVNWGGGWRIPHVSELTELIQETSQTWETLNGINGMRFTSVNGNSLFLPAGGNKFNKTSAGIGTFGVFWTADVNGSTSAMALSMSSGDAHIANYQKDGGKMVRGVITQ